MSSELDADIERLLRLVMEIGGGTCSITDGLIFAETDENMRAMLLGLLMVHEDLERERELRRKSEAHLRQSQKLQAVGTMTSGIAHDFNNMLGVILGNTTLLRRHTLDEHLRTARLNDIEQAATRASDLVRQMLAFSQKRERPYQLFFLGPLIEEGSALLRTAIPESIEIHTQIGSEVPPVLGDPAQLQQVLVNLCINAWHAYGNKAGRITITLNTALAPNLRGRSDLKPSPHVCLTVSDHGIGMDEDTISRAFDPFFTTKGIGKGTGLGLSVVHGVVSSHGGAIDVETAPGQGATFRIYLPASSQAAREHSPVAAPEPHVPSVHLRVLHIDDLAALGTVVSCLLGAWGHEVTSFTDPALALQALEREPQAYDLVLTDLHMPRISGLDVVTRVRELRPSLPVVIASGDISAPLAEDLVSAGARGVLSKPWSSQEFAAVLARALAKPEVA